MGALPSWRHVFFFQINGPDNLIEALFQDTSYVQLG